MYCSLLIPILQRTLKTALLQHVLSVVCDLGELHQGSYPICSAIMIIQLAAMQAKGLMIVSGTHHALRSSGIDADLSIRLKSPVALASLCVEQRAETLRGSQHEKRLARPNPAGSLGRPLAAGIPLKWLRSAAMIQWPSPRYHGCLRGDGAITPV